MVRIRRFGIIKTANMAAAVYAVIVLLFSLVILVPMAILGVAMVPSAGGAMVGAGVAGVLLFALFGTLIYAVIGWIMTAIACAFYNLVAGWVGGIEVQVEPTTPWGYPGYGAPGGYGGQYGAPGGYGAPPASYGSPGSAPPPPGIPG